MRESLTIAALALVVALTAALLGPYFYDWSQARGLIEARLSDSLGVSVRIAGRMDVRLLPTPYLVAENITTHPRQTGSGQGLDLSFHAHALRLELAPLSLLSGDLTFTDLTIDQPDIVLSDNKDMKHPPLASVSAAQSVHFEHIVLNEGTITLVDHDHEALRLSHISATGNAPSLMGPFKVDGSFESLAGPVGFHLNSGTVDNNLLRLKLALASQTSDLTLALDGALGLDKPDFDGTVKSRGSFVLTGQTVPFALDGAAHLGLNRNTSEHFELLLGREDSPLKFSGSAAYADGPARGLTASLTATTLDLDRSLAPAPDHLPRPSDLADRLRQAVIEIMSRHSGLIRQFELNIDSVILAQDSLAAVHLTADATGPAPHIQLSARAPAHAAFNFDGTLKAQTSATDDLGVEGRGNLDVPDTVRLQTWFYGKRPAGTPLFQKIAFNGPVRIDHGFESASAQITLDRSRLSGSLAYHPAHGLQSGQLSLNMRSDDLDLDSIPDLTVLQNVADNLDIKLDAQTMTLAKFGQSALSAGHIQLDMTRQGAVTHIKTLNVDSVGGSSLSASGNFSPQASDFSAHLNAPQPGPLISLLHVLLPTPLMTALKSRAAALSPLQLDITAEKGENTDDILGNWRKFSLSGTLADTNITLSLSDKDHALVHLDSPHSATLLAQLGLPSLPLGSSGSGEVSLKAWGLTQRTPHVDLNAQISGTELNAKGLVNTKSPSFDGQWSLHSRDSTPLLQTLAILLPDAQTSLPLNMSGTASLTPDILDISALDGTCAATHINGQLRLSRNGGAHVTGTLHLDKLDMGTLLAPVFGNSPSTKPSSLWPDTAFQTSLGALPDSRIELNVDTLGLGNLTAQAAQFGLSYSPGQISLDPVQLHLFGGQISGAASLRRAGASGSVSADTYFDGLDIASAALDGKASGQLNFAGTGQSWAAIVGGLAGTGSLSLRAGHIKMIQTQGLARVVTSAEQDQIASDAPNLSKALEAEFTAGITDIDPAPLNITMANGQIQFGPGQTLPRDKASRSPLTAGYDLRSGQFSMATSLTLSPLPQGWQNTDVPSIDISWHGPLASPQHKLDVGNLTNALAAKAIARSQARIEAVESDIRERAFFLRRLKAAQAATLRQKIEDELRKKAEDADVLKAVREILQSRAPPAGSPPAQLPLTQASPPLDLTPPQTSLPQN